MGKNTQGSPGKAPINQFKPVFKRHVRVCKTNSEFRFEGHTFIEKRLICPRETSWERAVPNIKNDDHSQFHNKLHCNQES